MKKNLKKIVKNIMPYGFIVNREQSYREKNAEIFETVEQRELYNKFGERIHTFYLQDKLCAHQPYGFVYGRVPRNVMWDRLHPGLDIHFYTHQELLKTVGNPVKKFAYFIESEEIVPDDYRIFEKTPGLEKEFECIFTHSDKLLNQYSNAKFLPPSGVWYGNYYSNIQMSDMQYERKQYNVSLVSSNKEYCDLHVFRKELALSFKRNGLVDTFGTFDGGKNVLIDDTLQNYRFSIVIENKVSDYYFTEKILNCFAAMTIPIYVGANKINEFFNEDGIIKVKELTIEAVEKIVKHCTEEYYNEHLEAVLDNYNRVQEFICVEDFLINHYGSMLK